jgi:hypothetical protein
MQHRHVVSHVKLLSDFSVLQRHSSSARPLRFCDVTSHRLAQNRVRQHFNPWNQAHFFRHTGWAIVGGKSRWTVPGTVDGCIDYASCFCSAVGEGASAVPAASQKGKIFSCSQRHHAADRSGGRPMTTGICSPTVACPTLVRIAARRMGQHRLVSAVVPGGPFMAALFNELERTRSTAATWTIPSLTIALTNPLDDGQLGCINACGISSLTLKLAECLQPSGLGQTAPHLGPFGDRPFVGRLQGLREVAMCNVITTLEIAGCSLGLGAAVDREEAVATVCTLATSSSYAVRCAGTVRDCAPRTFRRPSGVHTPRAILSATRRFG